MNRIIENEKSESDIEFLTLFVIVFYVATQMLSNIASSKIANVFGFSVDAGTFLYPLAFTLRDLIHKRLGKRSVTKIIIVSLIINIFSPIFFYAVSILPPAPTWEFNDSFKNILSPVIRISIASIVAGVVSELVDTEIYHLFVYKITKRFQWLRVLTSNAISIPIDTLIFVAIAFLGDMNFQILKSIFIFNCILKYSVSVLSIPMIYIVRER